MDKDTAFARILTALEDFNSDVEKARAAQAQCQEQVASAEYEVEQLKKLIAENALAE